MIFAMIAAVLVAIAAGSTNATADAPCELHWDNAIGQPGMDLFVLSLTVFDDAHVNGDGPSLYAGGLFTTAGDTPANRIAKWDGTTWSALGSGVNSSVRALTVFDDTSGRGDGPVLHVRGVLTSAGDLSANRIAKWGCVKSGVSADLNSDGVVDGADLLILLSEWGECADPDDCPADLIEDGIVDGADLLVLLSNWG